MVKDFLITTKKIFDPIHGFIRFDELEKSLIDSLPFQRLHYIHQLGITYLVYPGATHSRFEHSLGVMELATQMFTRICKNVRPDLFQYIPRKGSLEYSYWLKVLRIAALCHDLGHLPFSHVAEKDLLGDGGHEKMTLKIIQSTILDPFWKKIERTNLNATLSKRNIVEDVIKIALGEKRLKEIFHQEVSFNSWERVLSQIINGDFFGADRIDYLLRDVRATGIVFGLFDYLQMIEMLRILPSVDGTEGKWELGIDENGLESCEALLLARHFMHKRVYQYSSVKAYNFHLRRFMRTHFAKIDLENVERFLSYSDIDVIKALNDAAKDKKHTCYEDAKRIVERKDHYKAIPLSPNVTEKDLLDFQKTQGIPSDQIEWEFTHPDLLQNDISFPVSRRYLVIQNAKDCSELLAKIPSSLNNWVYLAPAYELQFHENFRK